MSSFNGYQEHESGIFPFFWGTTVVIAARMRLIVIQEIFIIILEA